MTSGKPCFIQNESELKSFKNAIYIVYKNPSGFMYYLSLYQKLSPNANTSDFTLILIFSLNCIIQK